MIARLSRGLAALACALGLVLGGLSTAGAIEADVVVLQGLDKITARTRTFRVPVGSSRNFGSLEITARHCYKTPPEEPPERKAFLEIVDVRPDRKAVKIFSGWMFASSPALNALEHPVYDVWVTDCKVTDASGSGSDGASAQ